MGIIDDVQAAATWIAAALTSSGYRADLSPLSLWELERFFNEQTTTAGKARPQGLPSEGPGTRLFALGAYLGEADRRDLGGAWHGDESDPQAEINVAVHLPADKWIWPIQRAMKRFKNGPEDNVAHHAILPGVDLGSRTELRLSRPYPG